MSHLKNIRYLDIKALYKTGIKIFNSTSLINTVARDFIHTFYLSNQHTSSEPRSS